MMYIISLTLKTFKIPKISQITPDVARNRVDGHTLFLLKISDIYMSG